MKKIVKSESGHKYFVLDKEEKIEAVFYTMNSAKNYINNNKNIKG